MSEDWAREQQKPKIIGQPRSLKDAEAESITQRIVQAQNSARQRTIPAEDLDIQATTRMSPAVAQIMQESRVLTLLHQFNRDYLYGMGRFDEYESGLLLKWGDGYSRKHIWVTVDGQNLIFATSHERQCSQPFCEGGRHVYTPELWQDTALIKAELADQLRRPIYERSDD